MFSYGYETIILIFATDTYTGMHDSDNSSVCLAVKIPSYGEQMKQRQSLRSVSAAVAKAPAWMKRLSLYSSVLE